VDVVRILLRFNVSITQNSQLSQLRNSLIREATALLPLLEAVIVFCTQTSVCRVLNRRTKLKLFDFPDD
jgi:hypothetical protein